MKVDREISFASRQTVEGRLREEAGGHLPPQADSSDPPAQDHLFIDNVRFWSMLAIIAMHSTVILGSVGKGSPALIQGLMTPFKFGTIAFFLISGFLLGERLDHCKPLEYLRRRVKRILVPWLAWLSLLVAFFLTVRVVQHRLTLSLNIHTLDVIGRTFLDCIFSTAFWFVPNLLLSLSLLVFFRRYLRDIRFGAVLFAVNFIYVLNIYNGWFPAKHNEALFGFVFYLWLGTYGSRHFGGLSSWIAKIPIPVFVTLLIATGLAAFAEARLLSHLQSVDPLNTLRLSNQIFSVTLVLFFLKVRRTTWPRQVNVKSQTFGLYLSHSMVLTLTVHMVATCLMQYRNTWILNQPLALMALWMGVTAAVYAVCLAMIKTIDARPGLRWSIGSEPLKTKLKPSNRLHTALDFEIPLGS